MKLYYSTEYDEVITEDNLREYWTEFSPEYETFSDYVSACMWYNNGNLIPLETKIDSLKKLLARAEYNVDKYGCPEEYADEIEQLNAEINMLSEYMKEEV